MSDKVLSTKIGISFLLQPIHVCVLSVKSNAVQEPWELELSWVHETIRIHVEKLKIELKPKRKIECGCIRKKVRNACVWPFKLIRFLCGKVFFCWITWSISLRFNSCKTCPNSDNAFAIIKPRAPTTHTNWPTTNLLYQREIKLNQHSTFVKISSNTSNLNTFVSVLSIERERKRK